MAGPSSNNPNETSQKETRPSVDISFPLNEILTKRTVLRFEQYNRNSPSDDATNDTTATINLPLPLQVPDISSIKTGQYDMVFASVVENFDSLTGMKLSDVVKQSEEFFNGSTNKNLARAIALMPTLFNDDRRAQAGIVGGVVKNPHTTTFFDGVNLRSYFLSWRFSPRSQEESDALNNIINTIKQRIHPEENLRGFALDYPDLVYVDFEGEAKDYLPQFYRSFISEMSVTNSAGEGMAFYKSGAPVYVELGLRFNETNIITRNVLRDGRL